MTFVVITIEAHVEFVLLECTADIVVFLYTNNLA